MIYIDEMDVMLLKVKAQGIYFYYYKIGKISFYMSSFG